MSRIASRIFSATCRGGKLIFLIFKWMLFLCNISILLELFVIILEKQSHCVRIDSDNTCWKNWKLNDISYQFQKWRGRVYCICAAQQVFITLRYKQDLLKRSIHFIRSTKEISCGLIFISQAKLGWMRPLLFRKALLCS